jgi:hypothetical protein
MFQELNKVTGGKPRATRRSSGGRRVILKALRSCQGKRLSPQQPSKTVKIEVCKKMPT